MSLPAPHAQHGQRAQRAPHAPHAPHAQRAQRAPHDPDLALALAGDELLGAFNTAGVLTAADVHVARTLGRVAGEADQRVLLAAAFAVRAVREGSVCVDLHDVRRAAAADITDPAELHALPWPDLPAWYAATRRSPLVAAGADGPADRPVRLVGDLVYLDRYWRAEQVVRAELAARATREPPPVDPGRLAAGLRRLFPDDGPDLQRLAAAACATGWLTIIAGGPGTGKTTTIGRILDLLAALTDPGQPDPEQADPAQADPAQPDPEQPAAEPPDAEPPAAEPPDGELRIALAAPTGKAAARLTEAVAGHGRGVGPASTLHRLLGARPDSHSRFRHDRANRLPYDVVIVDETSMVSLTLMSRLLEALRPDTRLVLVGDPDQLASVEAGAVLGDLVARTPRPGPDAREERLAATVPADLDAADLDAADRVRTELRTDVVRLRRPYRFGAGGGIDELAAAIRTGDPDRALDVLHAGLTDVEFVPDGDLTGLRTDVIAAGQVMYDAARRGDAEGALRALAAHRLLCAHRHGPVGVSFWNRQIEQWLAQATGGDAPAGEWYVGRPLLVTANDYEAKLYNGDTGVIVDRGGVRAAVFATGAEPVALSPTRLSHVDTAHAMTIHKSQGSQFEAVTVLLPDVDSPLLTRELLYTAVTRARTAVRLIGSAEAVRRAVTQPTIRASGLRQDD